MLQCEYVEFKKAMNELDDFWTDEKIAGSSFAEMPLKEAITKRSMELEEFNKALTTAVNYMLND